MARRKVIRVRIKGKLMTLREVSEKYPYISRTS